jgi:hypothetical protein
MDRPRGRPLRRFLLSLLLACTVAGSTATPLEAQADSQSRKSRGENPQLQARSLFKEAQSEQKAGNFKAALAKLQEAYQVLPTPTLLWPIAELRWQLDQPVEGLEALRRYRQEMVPAEMEPGQELSDADKLEEKLRAKLGYLRPQAAAGAKVAIDGNEVGRAPLGDRVAVNPGSHQITATSSRGRADTTVEVRAGQESEVALTETAVSAHYFPHSLTWAAIGLTGAFLLTSTVVGGIALSDTNALANDSRCVGRLCVGNSSTDILALNSQVDAQRAYATAASALLGVTGVLAVGTTVLVIYDWSRQRQGRTLLPSSSTSKSASLLGPLPTVGRDSAGLALGGRF